MKAGRWDAEAVVRHMIDAVSRTTLEQDPFPHFVIDGFFPPDFYRELIRCLPDPDLYEVFGYDRHGSSGTDQSRTRFPFENNSLDRLTGRQHELWYVVRSAFASPDLKEAVYDKLSPGLRLRFGCDQSAAKLLPGFPLPELFKETPGYRIKPHPDTNAKVVTMQVSLAGDNRQSDLGTEFYRPSFSPAALLREPRGFQVVKRMPFLPNSGYAFAVLNTLRVRSWHGRSTLPATAGVRHTLLNFWYLEPDRGNKDLARGSHLTTTHTTT